jgi:hypothetical protein
MELQHPLTSKVLQVKEHTPTLCSSVVFNLGFTFEYFKESEGVLMVHLCKVHHNILKKNLFIGLI